MWYYLCNIVCFVSLLNYRLAYAQLGPHKSYYLPHIYYVVILPTTHIPHICVVGTQVPFKRLFFQKSYGVRTSKAIAGQRVINNPNQSIKYYCKYITSLYKKPREIVTFAITASHTKDRVTQLYEQPDELLLNDFNWSRCKKYYH